jgi:type VI protein secretion system component Hcp
VTTEINAKTARGREIRELTEVELSQVTGGSDPNGSGKVAHTEFVITKMLDKASPVLF